MNATILLLLYLVGVIANMVAFFRDSWDYEDRKRILIVTDLLMLATSSLLGFWIPFGLAIGSLFYDAFLFREEETVE